MIMKKFFAVLVSLLLLCALFACTKGAGIEASDDGIDWEHMSMDELYEKAKEEGGVVKIYATTTDADTARKKIQRAYPDVQFEFISCDTNTIKSLLERDYDAGNVNADVVLVKDSSGEIYNGLVAFDILKIYRPAAICEHIDPELLKYGMPLYSTFNPWFYCTRDFPDGVPIESWWDIVKGYNVDTKSYKDANGNNTQYWTIYTKDIKAPSYAALWAQLIIDSDALVPCHVFGTCLEAVRDVKRRGYTVYAVETVEGASMYHETALRFPCAFVLGNEALGVEQAVLDECDACIALPALGQKNSINVGNCAAVVLFEALRQHRQATSTPGASA